MASTSNAHVAIHHIVLTHTRCEQLQHTKGYSCYCRVAKSIHRTYSVWTYSVDLQCVNQAHAMLLLTCDWNALIPVAFDLCKKIVLLASCALHAHAAESAHLMCRPC